MLPEKLLLVQGFLFSMVVYVCLGGGPREAAAAADGAAAGGGRWWLARNRVSGMRL